MRITACPGSRDSCPFPAGPAVSLIQLSLSSSVINANPDEIICEQMETYPGAAVRAIRVVVVVKCWAVERRVSRLARTRISRQACGRDLRTGAQDTLCQK